MTGKTKTKQAYFFCAIGGSGMMPLALMMKASGADVSGSDRGRDQGRTPERFAFLQKQGINLFPQNGSGLQSFDGTFVVSTAVEKTVPDYLEAIAHGVPILHRSELLAQIANNAAVSIDVAGTSGKTTTTGMIGWILHKAKKKPTIVNGAVMKNFVSADIPFASAVVGDPTMFVGEVDESDGSIARFDPTIAVLNNIAIDHKTMDELRALFGDFLAKAQKTVINLDNAESAALCPSKGAITYGIENEAADLNATALLLRQDGATFDVAYKSEGKKASVTLKVTGRHNVSNALAALGAALAAGVAFDAACKALASFTGIARRMDVIGQANDVTVIDDFAHNPDKIAASLRALRLFEGRLLILYQPHGYGPLKLTKDQLIDCFTQGLGEEDQLFIADPLYLGGTTDRAVGAEDIAAGIAKKGRQALYVAKREEAAAQIIKEARQGDRIVVMGARDDTLTELAKEILFHVGQKSV